MLWRVPKLVCSDGFSLVELLLTLTLSSLIFLCVFHVYLSVKSSYNKIEQIAVTQNHLRFLAYFLQHKIAMAGYAGCGKLANLDLKNSNKFSFKFANSVHGFSASNLPAELQGYNIPVNTDVIVIQKADEGISRITDEVIKVGATEFHAQENPLTVYNKNLLLSDCRQADLFVAKNIGGNLIQSETPMAHEYKEEATQVARFTEIAYFVSSSNSVAKTEGNVHGASQGNLIKI